ncbi:MAG: hypothetical protein J0H23_01045 [Micrococcales bacterium]|nr:hypothetical protein [Micrococcales bacterium]OJX66706.1 MAG: hypothetical protein BGO94_07630 [Micrococcales bacterium 72-143]
MSAPTAVASQRRPWLAISVVGTAAFAIAFFLLPSAVAEASSASGITTGSLAGRVGTAFSHWWLTSDASLPPDMAAVVSFWQVFHVTKVLVAIALLVALVATGYQVWQAWARMDGRAVRAGTAILGVLGAPLAPLTLLIVMANLQGAIAPLSSAMGLLPMDGSVAEVASVQEQFAAGTTTPVLDVLIDDFRTYHLVLVVTAGVAAALVLAADILMWVRRTRLPRTSVGLRRLTAMIAIVLPAVIPVLLFLMVVNLSTVMDTAPALAAFFAGSR